MIPIRTRTVFLLAGLWLAASASSGAQADTPAPGDLAAPAETEAPPAVRVLRTGGLRVETAALLWSGQQGGPVALQALAIPMPGKNPAAPDKVKVAVVVEAAARALAQAAEADDLLVLPVDVVIYALDDRGALAASVLETIEIRDPAKTLRTIGLRFVGGVALRPGSYTLSILVGHAASKTIGLTKVSLAVPAAAEVAPVPGYPPGGDGWLVVESLSARGFDLPKNLAIDSIAGIDPAHGWLERLAAAGAGAPDLPDPAANDADAPGHWRRSEAAALRATYARILARFGAGGAGGADGEEKALEEVAGFEVPLLSGPKAASREELTGLEGEVLRKLERQNPETLVPVMALYRTLHGVYQRRNLRQPAMHAAILVGSLAELYARAVPTPEGRRLAAGFLVSLTPNLDRSGLSSMVEAEFKRALELDPDHPQALLGHAQDNERHGRYAEAVAGLERLTAISPYDPEVAVRLAINTSRLSGKTKRAREMFLKILAPLSERPAGGPQPKGDAWPLALAAQELARLEIAVKDRAAARRTLALGLAHFPEDEKLLLLSAALADFFGPGDAEGAAAKEKLAQWTPSATSEIAPRLRYDELPRRRIEALWVDLERAGKERLPTLTEVLGPGGKAKAAP